MIGPKTAKDNEKMFTRAPICSQKPVQNFFIFLAIWTAFVPPALIKSASFFVPPDLQIFLCSFGGGVHHLAGFYLWAKKILRL
jgi:hypothetical protein